MTQNQVPNPDQLRSPYAANPTAPAAPVVRGVGAAPSALGVKPDARLAQAFLTQAFMWMFAGLLLTAGVAYVVQSNAKLLEFAEGNFFLLFLAQLGIVMVIAGAINRISATAALALFFVYAATLGVTIGLIVASYTTGSVASAFLSASGMFGAAAIYGHVTQRSLARIGSIAIMGVFGLLIAMLVNLFLNSAPITYLISIVGVVLFTAVLSSSTWTSSTCSCSCSA
jgi:FtsH-binding integral membrane protein